MKEQLDFSDVPWELRHCSNCDSCYWHVFVAKTFLKMSFLLKMMVPRHFSALENVMPYCHEACCPSRLRRSFKVLKEDLGEMETAASVHHKEHLIPQKSHCVQCLPILLVAVGTAAGWEPRDKVNCPCRHWLWPGQLLLRDVVTLELPTQGRLLGHPRGSPCCPGLWHSIWLDTWGSPVTPSTNSLARDMEEGHKVSGHVRGQVWWVLWDFWAHRARLLGVTVTSY